MAAREERIRARVRELLYIFFCTMEGRGKLLLLCIASARAINNAICRGIICSWLRERMERLWDSFVFESAERERERGERWDEL